MAKERKNRPPKCLAVTSNDAVEVTARDWVENLRAEGLVALTKLSMADGAVRQRVLDLLLGRPTTPAVGSWSVATAEKVAAELDEYLGDHGIPHQYVTYVVRPPGLVVRLDPDRSIPPRFQNVPVTVVRSPAE